MQYIKAKALGNGLNAFSMPKREIENIKTLGNFINDKIIKIMSDQSDVITP